MFTIGSIVTHSLRLLVFLHFQRRQFVNALLHLVRHGLDPVQISVHLVHKLANTRCFHLSERNRVPGFVQAAEIRKEPLYADIPRHRRVGPNIGLFAVHSE